jgi:hypothetical protein
MRILRSTLAAATVAAASLTATALAATVLPIQAAGATSSGTAAACRIRWGSTAKQDSATSRTDGLTDVRAGRHACFDRIVLDGADWARVSYVATVHHDASGRLVPLSGGARLQILTTRSDDVNGAATYRPVDPAHLVDVTGWQTLRQVAFAGSFEGQTTLGVGVRARLPFRVFVLTAPGHSPRVVIDVAHHW